MRINYDIYYKKIILRRIKFCLLILCLIFTAILTFNGWDCQKCDRDNALIISALNIINGTNIQITQSGLPITTGINKYLVIPFIYLFGDIQILSFIFWLIVLFKSYRGKHFIGFALFYLLGFIFYWNILHRQDEFYYPIALLYLTKNWYWFIIYFLLNRNWFAIPFGTTINFPNIWLGYCLYIPLLINYFLNIKKPKNENRL